jgi:hypothetical protein
MVLTKCSLEQLSRNSKQAAGDCYWWIRSSCLDSCAETWDQLRVKLPAVEWHKVVWFSQAIPRHAFILWLALRDL